LPLEIIGSQKEIKKSSLIFKEIEDLFSQSGNIATTKYL